MFVHRGAGIQFLYDFNLSIKYLEQNVPKLQIPNYFKNIIRMLTFFKSRILSINFTKTSRTIEKFLLIVL